MFELGMLDIKAHFYFCSTLKIRVQVKRIQGGSWEDTEWAAPEGQE